MWLIYQNIAKKCEAKPRDQLGESVKLKCIPESDLRALQPNTNISSSFLMKPIKCIRENMALAQKFT